MSNRKSTFHLLTAALLLAGLAGFGQVATPPAEPAPPLLAEQSTYEELAQLAPVAPFEASILDGLTVELVSLDASACFGWELLGTSMEVYLVPCRLPAYAAPESVPEWVFLADDLAESYMANAPPGLLSRGDTNLACPSGSCARVQRLGAHVNPALPAPGHPPKVETRLA